MTQKLMGKACHAICPVDDNKNYLCCLECKPEKTCYYKCAFSLLENFKGPEDCPLGVEVQG